MWLRSRPRFSTAQTLSLVTAGVVVAVLAAAIVVVRVTLTQSVVPAAQENLNATVTRLAILGGLLTFAGALVAWLIGRRVARPLVELTHAAELVARGDYSA